MSHSPLYHISPAIVARGGEFLGTACYNIVNRSPIFERLPFKVRLWTLVLFKLTPFWASYVVGLTANIPREEQLCDRRMSKVRKTWASYVAVLDQKLQRQLPPFVTTLLTVKCSSVMEQVFDVLEQVIIYANGSSHLSHQIDHAFQKLQWRSADHYAKQIALLHKANQETEKRLQELEKVKQKMEDMVVHYTPLVAEAEQHIQRAAESISSQHQQALRLKDKQTKIQLEPVLARLEKLLERQEAQWKEAIETLKDFKTAQEHLQNARREEREAQKLIAAALAENS